jgi:hypothetical protein
MSELKMSELKMSEEKMAEFQCSLHLENNC